MADCLNCRHSEGFHHPSGCIAHPDPQWPYLHEDFATSRGTADMVTRAKAAGIEVLVLSA